MMNCPICNVDLSPLDLVSRNEHVDLCLENGGPTIVQMDESGRLVAKKNVPLAKQRKICPICDKTFQNLNSHFKTCAIKNDVPPNLMLDYWEKINSEIKNPKKFPRELLDSFVNKCVKEGRVGEQVDFARALSLSMMEGSEKSPVNPTTLTEVTLDNHVNQQQQQVVVEATPTSHTEIIQQNIVTSSTTNAVEVLMQSAASSSNNVVKKSKSVKKYRLELVDENTKRTNVFLRIDRELAATRNKRYREALHEAQIDEKLLDDDCMILPQIRLPSQSDGKEEVDLDKLFHRARMKTCSGSELCLQATCQDHELLLLMEEFERYSGKSLDAPTLTSFPKGFTSEQQGSTTDQ